MRIGIDLGGTKIEVVVLSDAGEILFRKRVPTPRGDYPGTIAAVAGLVREAEQEVGETCTVGMGIPGTLSPVTGLVKNANSIWLNNQPFDKDLSKELDREVRLTNDANCLAVSEATDGAGAGKQLVFAAILGTGCGAGVAINGRVLNGKNGVAGEWGHNPLPWQDDEERLQAAENPCFCGNEGCNESFISGTGLCYDYFRHTGEKITGAEISERAQNGDEEAEAAIQRFERRVAKALSMIVNIMDPDVIVLGGGASNMNRLYTNVPPLMAQYVVGREFDTEIKKAVHGDSSGVRGAAWLWPQED
ncbi:fructokinase [Parasalinivibrio latis]|uniref:fructokinase n=1 Tax=Parasalinivibrio latis TaxID=2952610 RepID=UPI0030E395F2